MWSNPQLISLLLLSIVMAVTSLVKLKDGSLSCEEEGRFANPNHCSEFVDCVPNGISTTKLDLRHGSCRSGVFNSEVKKCLSARTAKNCTNTGRKARALTSDPNYSYMCQNQDSGFFCASCKTLVICIDGKAYPEPCGAGDMCDDRVDQYGGSVCYPGSPEACTCPDDQHELRMDPYNPRMFLECEAEGEDPLQHECTRNKSFDPESQLCIYPAGYYTCTAAGMFVDPLDCSRYHGCTFSVRSGWVHVSYECPCGEMFNVDTGICEDPCDWPTGDFVCEVEGRFSDPSNCANYFVCVAREDTQDFRQTRFRCPEGSSWLPTDGIEGQGMCVTSEQNPDCQPVVPSTCTVPQGWCDHDGQCSEGSEGCQCSAETGTLSCIDGYQLNGEACEDIDECASADSPCGADGECINTAGSFQCTCAEGYVEEEGVCVDLDECTTGDNTCESELDCQNTLGSYQCSCPQGYTDVLGSCEDIDECSEGNVCSGSATCDNTEGSYICACEEGYEGDGDTCTDIDECVGAVCDSSASCENTEGSFTCTCPAGYEGDGLTCSDIDECVGAVCDPSASCENTEGSFTCTCPAGYEGNGLTCSDVDECLDPNVCPSSGDCENIEGSYSCVCQPGFVQEGGQCLPECDVSIGNNCYFLGESGPLKWEEAETACGVSGSSFAIMYGFDAGQVKNDLLEEIRATGGIWIAGRRASATSPWHWHPSGQAVPGSSFILIDNNNEHGTDRDCLTLADISAIPYQGSHCQHRKNYLCHRFLAP